MKKYALVGKELQHSISVFVHQELFRLRKMKAEYCLLPLSQLDLKPLEEFDGYNVTFPYKESILPMLEIVDETALKLGAVNTVKDGIGYNTDIKGFEQSINMLLNGASAENALVLGCGGTGKVCCHHLSDRGMKVTVAVRNTEKAEKFVKGIKDIYQQPISVMNIKDVKGDYDLLVHATPVGTYPKTNQTVINSQYVKTKFLLDTVYNPKTTQISTNFFRCGAKVMNGLTMLVWQAAEAQKLWLNYTFTGEEIGFVVEQSEKHLAATFPLK